MTNCQLGKPVAVVATKVRIKTASGMGPTGLSPYYGPE